MSEIREMNRTVRRRAALAGIGFAVVAAFAISPEAALDLAHDHKITERLWWYALTGAFWLLALLFEAFEVGRHPRHRTRVNTQITRTIVAEACGDPACPQRAKPNDSIREAAMAVFYREIDTPSREVAFFQWTWYYTAILWTWLAVAAALLGGLLAAVVPTHDAGLRWLAIGVLGFAAFVSYALQRLWADKTMSHAQHQLVQIRGRLVGALAGASCENPQCPST